MEELIDLAREYGVANALSTTPDDYGYVPDKCSATRYISE